VSDDAKEDLCIPIKSTNLAEAFYNIILIASSYTALIILGINENWCRLMQRRTFAYRDLCIPGPLHTGKSKRVYLQMV